MEILCDKTLLCGAVDGVFPATVARSSIPVLEGILLKAEGFQLTLTGYDLEIAITTTIEANVRVPGEIVLNAKDLKNIVHGMPTDEVCIEVNNAGIALITGGKVKYDIPAMVASDFPDLPNPGADHTFSIPAGELREMIEKTIYAVSKDDKRPAHTGELFEIEPDKLTMVALDGYRLAVVERPIQAAKDIRIIVPAKTMEKVRALIGDGSDEVSISANRRFVVFAARGYTVISRLIEGEFLAWRGVIPEGNRTRVVLDAREFGGSIDRAMVVINERLKNPLRVTFGDGRALVRCQTAKGKFEDESPAEIQGETVEIGFNIYYLQEALRRAGAERLAFELNGPLSPVKVLPVNGDDFTYLVLPVRFKNEP